MGPVASEQGMTAGPVDVRTLARSFDVEYVLDGELLASGTLLRLCISVHDGATGAVVWSETFEGSAAAGSASRTRTTSYAGSRPPSATCVGW